MEAISKQPTQYAEPEDILELFDIEEFEPELEILENILPCPIYDEDFREELPNIIEGDPEEMAKIVGNFDLMIKILEESQTVEKVETAVAKMNVAVRNCYEGNMKTVFEKTKPYEKTIRSLQLLYENANGQGDIYLIPVKKEKFADAANPKHFKAMQHYLQQQFYKFKMENSPFYISYIGDIGSKTAIQKMAKIAMQTRALAVLDIKECKTSQAAIDYAKRVGITGIPASLGHVVIPATWGYKQGAKEILIVQDKDGNYSRKEQKMTVALAGGFIGRMIGEAPGNVISGLESDAINGLDGVKMQYDLEKKDAEMLDEVGLNMVLASGHIQGSTTANKSNNADLRKYAKVDVANALLKDLVQFCNNKAYSKWDNLKKKEFKKEVTIYLNNRFKQGMIGKDWEIEHIKYDPDTEAVDISITIPFFEVVDEFNINLVGKKGNIDVNNNRD